MAGKLPAGTTINGRYTIVRKLGTYGDVYAATDAHLNSRTVAIKLLFPDAAGVRPWDEAHLLERLRSRFLVDVINADVVTNSDIRYIVTPLLTNGDLESVAAGVGLGVQQAVHHMHQVAMGVDRIHAEGMIHRDIKPGNVLIGDDGVFVIDLEYCILLNGDGHAGRNGTWCTLAPESAPDGGYCSLLSDVYSLAATAFYALSGVYPVDHSLPVTEQQSRIAVGDIRELRLVAPHISQGIGTVIRKGLNLDPARRFDSALAFGNALAKAARNSRDWRRTTHPGHAWCLEGGPASNRAPVTVCAMTAGPNLEVQARLVGSGRRVANIADATVTPNALARTLQGIVKRLG